MIFTNLDCKDRHRAAFFALNCPVPSYGPVLMTTHKTNLALQGIVIYNNVYISRISIFIQINKSFTSKISM